MKILHTSDWHLGQTFYDYDRGPEHQDMLRQITEIVSDEQPDALLLSGDVFHTGSPSPAAVRLYNSALLAMHSACPAMQIVVTAGNHDSATRLVVNNDLWNYFKVTVIGTVARSQGEQRTADFSRHIIPVTGKGGATVGFVAAVPHCYASNFPAIDNCAEGGNRMAAYFQGLRDAIAAQNPGGLPVVLMAHMAVSGCDLAGHDSIGGMETTDASIFGNGYDYVALGHIHTPQDIGDRVRYCGTPIPVNFGEKFQHSVSVVTLQSGQPPVIETRPVKNLIPLHDLPREARPFSEVIEMLRDYDDDELCYLRVLIKVDSTMTPLAETLVGEATKGKRCRVCKLQPVYQETTTTERAAVAKMTKNELKAKTPVEIAELLYKMRNMELTPSLRSKIEMATIEAERTKKGDTHED